MKRLFKLLSAAVVTITLVGCSTFEDIEAGLDRYAGRHVDTLIDLIGFPSYVNNFGERTIYVWDSSQTISYSMPQTVYHSGTLNTWGGGAGSYGGTSTVMVPTTAHYFCKIIAEVDKAQNIIGWEYDGNIGGCQRYAKLFNK